MFSSLFVLTHHCLFSTTTRHQYSFSHMCYTSLTLKYILMYHHLWYLLSCSTPLILIYILIRSHVLNLLSCFTIMLHDHSHVSQLSVSLLCLGSPQACSDSSQACFNVSQACLQTCLSSNSLVRFFLSSRLFFDHLRLRIRYLTIVFEILQTNNSDSTNSNVQPNSCYHCIANRNLLTLYHSTTIDTMYSTTIYPNHHHYYHPYHIHYHPLLIHRYTNHLSTT
jgi:hypothetical protein